MCDRMMGLLPYLGNNLPLLGNNLLLLGNKLSYLGNKVTQPTVCQGSVRNHQVPEGGSCC